MRITYDPEADAVYIALRDAKPRDARRLDDWLTFDLDAKGRVIGIEILDASERLGSEALEALGSVDYERLLPTAG